MFDTNVFIDGSCKNYSVDDEIKGFELQTNITYYRGIPLSMLEFITVMVDGEKCPEENITVSVDTSDWFTLKEAETVTSYKWEYGDPLYIRVAKDGGLSKGEHLVSLTVATRTAYIPVPMAGTKERTVCI